MTPEEKNALINFFGNVYSLSKQTDTSVVQGSKDISPIGETVKRELENVLSTDQVAAQMTSAQATSVTYSPPPTSAVVNVLPATDSMLPAINRHNNSDEIQLELNFTKREADNITEILKRIESKITKIITILSDDKKAVNTTKEPNIKVPRLSSSSK